jgi:hypothetical protein
VVNVKPVFTSANSTNAVHAHSFSFQVTATGYPAPSFSASGLPTGVTLNSSGVLSGSVTKAGTYTFTITASSSAGVTTQSFTLKIT